MANEDIKNTVKLAGVRLWEVAEAYGVNDGNFSRKLRKELPQEEKQTIMEIIERLSKEKREVV